MLEYYWNRVLKKIRGKAVRNSVVPKTSKVESGSQVIHSSFGKYSFCGYDCKIINCEIGNFTSIADNVIIGGARHPMEWVSTSPVFYAGRDSIKKKFSTYSRDVDLRSFIGNDVWIGEGVFIKAGVSIGDGAIIGMGSVVTKNVEPYCIVGGVPARLIKKRFDDDIIARLLKVQWWNFTDEQIQYFSKEIMSPEDFIKDVESIWGKEWGNGR